MAHTGRSKIRTDAGPSPETLPPAAPPARSSLPRKGGALRSPSAPANSAHTRALARASRSRRSLLPFKTADVYLFGQVLASTMRGIAMYAGLLVLFAGLAMTRKALPLSAALHVLLLELPRIVLFSLPMSLVYGSLHTFTELSSRGEITALKAGGLSLVRMMRAPMVFAAGLCIVAFVLQEVVVPHAEQGKDKVMVREIAQGLGVQKDFRYIDPPGGGPLKRIIQAREFDPRSNTLVRPSLQFYGDDRNLSFTITAQSGTWDDQTGGWKFRNGKVVSYSDKSADSGFNASTFETLERTDLPDAGSLSKAGKSRVEHILNGDYEMFSIGDMADYRTDMQQQLTQTKDPSEVARIDTQISAATFAIHDKIATPLVCLAFILVGVPLGMRPQRAVGGVSVGLSLIVIFAYYIVWSWASLMGRAGAGNALFMAYIALLTTALAGALLTWKKTRWG